MKKFTKQEVRYLLDRVMMEEISFSEMVEVINQRINESEVSEFKEGDFLHSDWDNENLTLIYKEQEGNKIYHHAYKSNSFGVTFAKTYWRNDGDFRPATEAEKQELLDALAKEGKRWNEEKKCVEDIPVSKFKIGDKVRIKDGVSSWSHRGQHPCFAREMDDLIGKTMTIELYCDRDIVLCEKLRWQFKEDWLEPYVEGLKRGDLAIFWDEDKRDAAIRIYEHFNGDKYFTHRDHSGLNWRNAIKFESIEQYERFIKGEI